MSDPYLGEIRMFAGNYAPANWALCNGQLLNIADYQPLYSLIGNAYGGDGTTTFAVPDLQGRIPIHPSLNYPFASNGGVETVTLTLDQLPAHTHAPYASTTTATVGSPSNNVWATTNANYYSNGVGQTPVSMNPQAVSSEGGNQPHDNMMPSLTVSFIICLQGTYPQS